MQREVISRQQVVDLIMTLPLERLISVYDFVRFVKLQPVPFLPEDDIFGETEDEILADEERWEQQFEASRDALRARAHEAAAEFRAGRTTPMEFTPEGCLAR